MIGTGYVGLVSGSCLADFGNTVRCVDIDADRIDTLRDGRIPIYEPGLEDMVARNVDGGRLLFTTDLADAVANSDVIFIAVGTPPQPDGSTDLSYVFTAAEQVAKLLSGYKVIVQKSTAPVGTARKITEIIREHAPAGAEFDVVSNPEFLREGSAVGDFLRPNRVVIGVESERARDIMKQVYRPLYLLETPVVLAELETAELIKYASNAFLATKISFINEMARISELVGANIDGVAKAMGLDRRIGPKFLHSGIGYGGSCFPKDVSSLAHIAREAGYEAKIVGAVIETNRGMAEHAIVKVRSQLGDAKGKTVGILGLAFKPNTDDVREAPSAKVVQAMIDDGATVRVYDPVATENFLAQVTDQVVVCKSAYEAAEGAHATVLVTEWNEFRVLDLARLKSAMADPVFIDCRNVYNPQQMKEHGIRYDSFGRGSA